MIAIRVLLVDDALDWIKTLGALLKIRGYVVEAVTDSTRCLTQLESFNPDVVLLDIAMPKVSGYEIARQIRLRAEFESVAIICVSGYGDREHMKQSIEAGCDQHLVKPVSLVTLEAAIAQERDKRRPKHKGEPSDAS